MKKSRNAFTQTLRYICLIFVITLGFITIVATGGGRGGGGGNFVIYNYPDKVIATIPLGVEPYGIAITPDGSYAYVTNNNDNILSVIRTSDNTVIDTISVGDSPRGIAITPDGRYVYVVNNDDNTVSVIGFFE